MKIKIRYEEEEDNSDLVKTKNYISIYLFGIRIKKIKLRRKVHGKKELNANINTIYMIVKQIIKSLDSKEIFDLISNILKSAKIPNLNLELGINFNDPIVNAYIISFINAILPLYIASTMNNTKNIYYNTFVSDKTLYIKARAVIKFSIVRNIKTLVKILFVVIKTSKRKDKTKRESKLKELQTQNLAI